MKDLTSMINGAGALYGLFLIIILLIYIAFFKRTTENREHKSTRK